MAIFEKITLIWKGKEYFIPPDQVMRAIAKIEDVISMVQIARCFENRDLPLVKISQAYGAALRHAGARVDDEEIYADLFSSGQLQQRAIAAIQTLQIMMIPPEHLRQDTAGKDAAGATSRSSKRRSKQP